MIDHFNLPVSNIEKSLQLYQQILAVLGHELLFKDQDAYGFGTSHWQFGIYPQEPPIAPLHLAFHAVTKAQVDKLHDTAVELGAESNGKPGFRLEYGPGYYAAYIHDFDGHNIEVVCRLSD